jgi:glutaredoxin
MRLDIFVEPGCACCEAAIATAAEIARRFPELKVKLIDLAEAREDIPEAVFAVPTYILDGKMILLGNPRLDDLSAAISGPDA